MADKRLYLVTTRDGKTKYTASLTDEEKSELIGKGASVEDPATGMNNSSSIMSEAEGEKITKNDLLNITKSLDTCVKDALRKNEDGVAYTQQFFNKNTNSIVIEVSFERDKDNPGAPSTQRFEFKLGNKKIAMKTENGYIDVAQLTQQSGTININKDVATDVIFNSVKQDNETTGHAGEVNNVDNAAMGMEGNLEEFKAAVQNYRKMGRTKETIKELFKASRSFPGDNIQAKFKNAASEFAKCPYCSEGEETQVEPQIVSPSDPRTNDSCDCEGSLKLDMSLFIRLLEYAREDSKEDVDLHFVAENLDKICKEKGCACMDDYQQIISKSTPPEQGKEMGDEKEEAGEEQDELDEIIRSGNTDMSVELEYCPTTGQVVEPGQEPCDLSIRVIAHIKGWDIEIGDVTSGRAGDIDVKVVGGESASEGFELGAAEAKDYMTPADYRNIKRYVAENLEYLLNNTDNISYSEYEEDNY